VARAVPVRDHASSIWVRALMAECRAAGVAIFMKQMGASPCDGLVHGTAAERFRVYAAALGGRR
jgi:hypothetical protein